MNKSIIFVSSGRFGNAVFRYMACSLINIIHPELNHKYTLNTEYNPPASFFDFYKGSDCEQNDAFFININNETIISELLTRYKYNNSIMGFNTLGYVKHTIDTSKLISNQYINESNGHGIYIKNTIRITDDNYMNLIYDVNKIKNVNLLMDGYFQFSYIYLQYKPQILEYMDKHKHEHKIQTDRNDIFFVKDIINDIELDKNKIYDIAIHIRLGDFNGRLDFIEPQYYIKLFETIDIKSSQKICLIHEPITNLRDGQYIQELIAWFKSKNININVEYNSLLVDFNIMKQATILVCSMSTLSWIAAYVSNHIKKCYMPNYNFYNKVDPSNSLDRSNVYFNYPIENTVLYDISSVHPIISKIKTQLLTLPQYSYRLNKLNILFENLTKIGIKPNIFNGVYGKDIIFDQNDKNDNTQLETITWNNTTYNYNKNIRLNGARMMNGEFGCVWSHINIYKQMIEKNDKYYLVLEDDVCLVKSIDQLFNLLNNIPADADYCHLALSDWYPFILTEQKNEYFYKCKKTFFNRTTAYIISLNGAKKIINYIGNEINLPIDDLINTIYRTTLDFNVYVPKTYYFKEQNNTESIIKDINK